MPNKIHLIKHCASVVRLQFANTLEVCECTSAGSCRDKAPVRSTGDRGSHANQQASANNQIWYDKTQLSCAIAISIRHPYRATRRQLQTLSYCKTSIEISPFPLNYRWRQMK